MLGTLLAGTRQYPTGMVQIADVVATVDKHLCTLALNEASHSPPCPAQCYRTATRALCGVQQQS